VTIAKHFHLLAFKLTNR